MRINKYIKRFLIWYVIAIILLIILVALRVLFSDLFSKWRIFYQSIWQLFSNLPTYFVLLVPYLFSVLFRSFKNDYKKRKTVGVLRGFAFKVMLPVVIIWLSVKIINDYRLGEDFHYNWDYSIENTTDSIKNLYAKDRKQRGFHVFGMLRDSTSFELLKKNNVEWITMVPFLSQTDFNTPSINTNLVYSTAKDKYDDWREMKRRIDTYGFKMMFKPHVWLSNRDNGIWRGQIKMKTQADWDTWFTIYRNYILDYAHLAEELHIELFCIGTELHTTIVDQPQQWRKLIADVRKVYSGKLTYGANWDSEVFDIPFWDDLDFIGIQAYYPIATYSNPDLDVLEAGWNSHVDTLESLSIKYNKPILFTELGYKSTDDAAIKPWEWNTLSNRFHKKISKRTQALCYQAFFNTVWKKDWFEGLHIWEWQSRSNDSDGNNNAFTVQGKPALNIIAKGFERPVD